MGSALINHKQKRSTPCKSKKVVPRPIMVAPAPIKPPPIEEPQCGQSKDSNEDCVELSHLGASHACMRVPVPPTTASSVSTKQTSTESAKSQDLLPLHAALLMKSPDALITLRILLKSSADPSAADEEGVTALHVAALCGHKDATIALLEARASPNCYVVSDGSSPLHAAAEKGHGTVVSLLLERKAHVDATDLFGATALHHAAKSGSIDALRVLLRNPWSLADPNVSDLQRRTPLHMAVLQGKADIARTLIKAGASTRSRDKCGDTPLNLALRRHDDEVAIALVDSVSLQHQVQRRKQRTSVSSLRLAATATDELAVCELTDIP